MPETIMTEGIKSKRVPKVLKHLEVAPRMGGGVHVTHHYIHYQHEPEVHSFKDHEGERAMKHIGKHAGLMIDEEEGSEPDSWESEQKGE